MKRVVIEMPLVSECLVGSCAYNMNNNCHARAITIGDSFHPGCDTYTVDSRHTRNDQRIAGIGACKCTDCEHNEDYECMTDSIQVTMINNEANCITYLLRT